MSDRAWVVTCARAVLAAGCTLVVGCSAGSIGDVEGNDPPPPLPAGETQPEGVVLDTLFAQAGAEFDVPASLLKAIAWVETRAQMIRGEEEFPGRPAAYGLMALRGENLERGALAAGVTIEEAMTARGANIRAGAALLSVLADARSIDRDDIGDWADVVVDYSGIESLPARAHYIHAQVYPVLRNGILTEELAVEPLEEASAHFPQLDSSPEPGPDYGASYWRPSPNYSSRPAGTIGDPQMVIIHSCEGSYAGCWSWLKNGASGVSAHYVVNESGTEITQLVREKKKAWHIGAKYKCGLNAGVGCDLDGYSSNNFTIGIEHAGYANQPSWDSGLIHASAKLVCDVTSDQGIARDKYHIVAHGQLQPYNRIDPGPNWPWASYLDLVDSYCGASPPPPEEPPEEEPPPEEPPVLPGDFDVVVDSNNALNGSNAVCEVSSNWTASSNVTGYFNTGYWWRSTGSSSDLASFEVYLHQARTLTVYAWWTPASDRSTTAPFIVYDGNEVQLDIVYVNQRDSGGQWVELGTYAFTPGWNAVALSRWTSPGSVVVADAVRFVEGS